MDYTFDFSTSTSLKFRDIYQGTGSPKNGLISTITRKLSKKTTLKPLLGVFSRRIKFNFKRLSTLIGLKSRKSVVFTFIVQTILSLSLMINKKYSSILKSIISLFLMTSKSFSTTLILSFGFITTIIYGLQIFLSTLITSSANIINRLSKNFIGLLGSSVEFGRLLNKNLMTLLGSLSNMFRGRTTYIRGFLLGTTFILSRLTKISKKQSLSIGLISISSTKIFLNKLLNLSILLTSSVSRGIKQSLQGLLGLSSTTIKIIGFNIKTSFGLISKELRSLQLILSSILDLTVTESKGLSTSLFTSLAFFSTIFMPSGVYIFKTSLNMIVSKTIGFSHALISLFGVLSVRFKGVALSFGSKLNLIVIKSKSVLKSLKSLFGLTTALSKDIMVNLRVVFGFISEYIFDYILHRAYMLSANVGVYSIKIKNLTYNKFLNSKIGLITIINDIESWLLSFITEIGLLSTRVFFLKRKLVTLLSVSTISSRWFNLHKVISTNLGTFSRINKSISYILKISSSLLSGVKYGVGRILSASVGFISGTKKSLSRIIKPFVGVRSLIARRLGISLVFKKSFKLFRIFLRYSYPRGNKTFLFIVGDKELVYSGRSYEMKFVLDSDTEIKF
jgi:hypothetical protein